MAKKRRSKKKDDGLGCVFSMFELLGSILLLLFSSGNATAKKVGWGILGSFIAISLLGSVGVSGGAAFLIVGVVVVIILVVIALRDEPSEDKSSKTTGTEYTNKQAVTKPVKKETFEEQLKRMQLQAKVVSGEDFPVSEVKTTAQKVKEKYYSSVEEAMEVQTIPAGYQKIMIEQIRKTDIKECPALIWKDKIMLYVFPLLRNSKIYNWPLASVPIILYEKRINPNVDKEFMEVGEADIAREFENLFPEYPFGQEGVYTGKFILPVGLEVTNTSGKVIFDMLLAEFHVVDDITQSVWYAKEIKDLYQKNILKENGIISFEKYAEEKQRLLEEYKSRERDEEKYEQQLKEAKELQLL